MLHDFLYEWNVFKKLKTALEACFTNTMFLAFSYININ